MGSRSWCFTLNNYTEEEQIAIEEIQYRYLIYGLEDQGTPHLQGYIELNKPQRLTAMKKLIPRGHFEIRQGTREEARDYCKKEGNWEEFGNWDTGGSGTRNDLDKVRNAAIEEGMRGVTQKHNLQQIRVAEKFLTYNEEPRDWKPYVEWITGPTGSGKSRLAREKLTENDIYTKNSSDKWWDGYDGHDAVIIDDFRDSWWSLTEMLSLLDRYEKRIEYKGGYRQFVPKKIIITSIKSPEECYKGTGEDLNQLIRRIDTVTRLCNEVEGVILVPFDI